MLDELDKVPKDLLRCKRFANWSKNWRENVVGMNDDEKILIRESLFVFSQPFTCDLLTPRPPPDSQTTLVPSSAITRRRAAKGSIFEAANQAALRCCGA